MRNAARRSSLLIALTKKAVGLGLLLIGTVLAAMWPLIAKAIEPKDYVLQSPPTPIEQMALVAPLSVPLPDPAKPPTVEEMVKAEFPDAPVMVDIARAESKFVPTAKNPNSTALGVFQILKGTWNGAGCTGERTNASDNIRCARKLYTDSGTSPWVSSSANW